MPLPSVTLVFESSLPPGILILDGVIRARIKAQKGADRIDAEL